VSIVKVIKRAVMLTIFQGLLIGAVVAISMAMLVSYGARYANDSYETLVLAARLVTYETNSDGTLKSAYLITTTRDLENEDLRGEYEVKAELGSLSPQTVHASLLRSTTYYVTTPARSQPPPLIMIKFSKKGPAIY
jgi:hypothetical protein